jgi:mannitol/fructose-specific phosphotransferase system IIA component (Ntr-type)
MKTVYQRSRGLGKTIEKSPLLSELIPPGRISLGEQAADWKAATRAAGRLLLRDQIITPAYIEAMIQTAEELGPYIVIAPGIAMPHARPDAGALKTGMSLVKLSTPVNFGSPYHDPVTLVFALAAIDKRLHVRAMQALAELFLSHELVEKLMAAGTVEAVQAVFFEAEELA